MVELDKVKRKLGPGVTFFCNHFHAAAGSRMALWGPSGCGKSTMLNLISGLLRPDSGVIRIDGKEIQKVSESGLDAYRAERMGFVFQTFNLLAPFTVLQNVILGMRFADVIPEKEWKPRSLAMLERVGLAHRLKSKPGTLSVGERQRVAIARALANAPALIFADEPPGNLDSRTGHEIMQILDDLAAQGRSIILVTHERSIAEHAKRIVQLADGLIASDERI